MNNFKALIIGNFDNPEAVPFRRLHYYSEYLIRAGFTCHVLAENFFNLKIGFGVFKTSFNNVILCSIF